MTHIHTNHTTHLGDGAYLGQDPERPDCFWLGANHHENMTVCLGPKEIIAMLQHIIKVAPEFKEYIRHTLYD